MWDNAALLRSIANALFAFSACAVLYGAIYYTVHLPNLFPVQSVYMSAAPEKVSAAEVLQVVRSEVRGNFFTVDIERLRRSIEKLPWVRTTSIRREFPNRLVMKVEEHQALAHWNNAALVNQQGEVFVAESTQVLPNFIGPDDASHEVAEQYEQFSQRLTLLNLRATRVVLSARHAWQVRLSNDMVLELGRENMQQRLARFVAVYPYSLAAMQGENVLSVKYVDLRYPNGFTVSSAIKS